MAMQTFGRLFPLMQLHKNSPLDIGESAEYQLFCDRLASGDPDLPCRTRRKASGCKAENGASAKSTSSVENFCSLLLLLTAPQTISYAR